MKNATFTEADEGKPVVDINDDRVGTVIVVKDGIAYVSFKPHLITTLESSFGINLTEDELYPLQDEMIDRVNDESIRLRGDHIL